ncbi:MAG: DUF4405 domain-containing protein [Candidatus Marinimicrobia bacterium]|nr:DUF4405 domain-containing protein [Candidatus Neomarinimicrobiota bacterium]
MARQKKKFNFRGFVSLYIALSFLIISISGLMLYMAPPGRIAHWSHWTFGALTKEQWQAIHTVFSVLFVLMAAFHLYFNWKPIVAYFREKIQTHLKMRKEFIAASSAMVGILLLTLLELPPFQPIMDLSESLTNSWSSEAVEPPVPHAELMTVSELAIQLKMQPGDVRTQLLAAGIELPAEKSATIQEIADANGLSPSSLYQNITLPGGEQAASQSPPSGGAGYGRMTVAQLAERSNIEVQDAVGRLAEHGIEADPGSNLRQLSADNNLTPLELVDIIQQK